jgi:hypothetical protein
MITTNHNPKFMIIFYTAFFVFIAFLFITGLDNPHTKKTFSWYLFGFFALFFPIYTLYKTLKHKK